MKNNKIKVSVFIPCYNMGEFIEDAIESVYAQTYKDYEIIVVDDGSTDQYTLDLLKKIGTLHPDIRMFFKENSGLSGAKNYGIEKAVGEYIVCLDADDKLAPTYIEKTVSLIEQRKNDNVAFVTTWLQEFGLRNNIWKTSGYDVTKLLITNVVHAGSMFRKDVWEKVGGFKKVGASYEDWEFWMNIVEAGYKWDVVDEVLFYYRIRANSLLTSAQSTHLEIYSRIFDLHQKLYKKHFKEFTTENAQLTKDLRNSIGEKDKAISELEQYRDEVVKLREKVHTYRDEIHTLRNSRVLGRIIKLREVVGSTRGAINQFPRKSLHKVRVIGAPLVHPVLRKNIKKIYRKSKDSLNEVSVLYINQVAWDKTGPLVSVVVPYYNASATIDETLNSIKAQTFTDYELIVVNDGSTDHASIEKLNNLEKLNKDIVFVTQKNQGPAAARNTGVARAKGKYIVCLDSDDWIEPTYIEKTIIVLETNPDTALVSSYTETFGAKSGIIEYTPYDPLLLFENNMLIHAAMFRKEAWAAAGGYKSGIGYEDWEYWITLAEKGYWGKILEEPLFHYRVSIESRYVNDKDAHWHNLKSIKALHQKYKKLVKKLQSKRKNKITKTEPHTALINISDKTQYSVLPSRKDKVLIAIPWMTFGGAETLIYNYCREIKNDIDITFITGLKSKNEWEYKFKEITSNIYHLANMFDDPQMNLEFISNYIQTRDIKVLHIVHNGFMFNLLPELKLRHPELKVIVTMFNDFVEYFETSIGYEDYIDIFVSDNEKVATNYRSKLKGGTQVRVIPNGINCYEEFSRNHYDHGQTRKELGLIDNDISVFFVGRLSEEKNPDVFIEAAKKVLNKTDHQRAKFFVIGDGIMKSEIEKLIKESAEQNIKYLGYQPSTEVARYLSVADIFVLPSRVEGFPLSILEAMAMETAVVASDVGAVAQVLENGKDGFVVTPGSTEEISESILKLMQDHALLKAVKQFARDKVEKKYSNKILGANYKKLYTESD